MSSSNNNPYMQPGSEITKVDHNVSPAGLQARAAATQTEHAAPSGTTYTDPALYTPAGTVPSSNRAPSVPAGSAESYMQPGSNVSSVGSHISPGGAQARAAALQTDFSAPQGTVRTETLGEAPGAPTASPMGISPDVNVPSPTPAYARAPQQAEYKPVDALNTAREVFQPTSPNQPQTAAFEQPPQQQMYQQQYQQQFAAPQYSHPAHQQQQQPPQYNAPPAQPEKPYTFTPQQPKQNFNYTYVPQQQSGSSAQAAPFNSASSVNPQTQTYSPQHSAAGSMARTAATQTSSSHPAGTRSATTTSPSYRTVSDLARGSTFQPQTFSTPSVSSAPSEVPQFSANAASPGMAARVAAQKGAHPAGTGPDAGVIGTPNFAAQNPSARVDISQQFSPAGLAARAAAAGQAPAGTGASFPKTRSAPQQVRYEAPARQVNLSPEQQVSPAGMQARELAYGKHPAGTGPGSVPGRSFSTMAGPARRGPANAAVSRVNPAMLRRRGGLVIGAAAAASLLFSS